MFGHDPYEALIWWVTLRYWKVRIVSFRSSYLLMFSSFQSRELMSSRQYYLSFSFQRLERNAESFLYRIDIRTQLSVASSRIFY